MTATSTKRRLAVAGLLAGAALTGATGVAYATGSDGVEAVWATVVDDREDPGQLGPVNTDNRPADGTDQQIDSNAAEGSDRNCIENGNGSDGSSDSGGSGSAGGSDRTDKQQEDVC